MQSGDGNAADSQLSEAHRAWAEKGAVDFVPSAGTAPAASAVVMPFVYQDRRAYTNKVDRRGWSRSDWRRVLEDQHADVYVRDKDRTLGAQEEGSPFDGRASTSPDAGRQNVAGGSGVYPGAAAPAAKRVMSRGPHMAPMTGMPPMLKWVTMPVAWPPMTPAGHWQSFPRSGLGPSSARSRGSNLTSSQQSTHFQSDPSEELLPRTVVLAWQLHRSYTIDQLTDELREIDFHFQDIETVDEGTFIMAFKDSWHAEALIVGLDETPEPLAGDGGLVRFTKLSGLESVAELPIDIQQGLEALPLSDWL